MQFMYTHSLQISEFQPNFRTLAKFLNYSQSSEIRPNFRIIPKCIYPECIFVKCTRLACLLSFASLFTRSLLLYIRRVTPLPFWTFFPKFMTKNYCFETKKICNFWIKNDTPPPPFGLFFLKKPSKFETTVTPKAGGH